MRAKKAIFFGFFSDVSFTCALQRVSVFGAKAQPQTPPQRAPLSVPVPTLCHAKKKVCHRGFDAVQKDGRCRGFARILAVNFDHRIVSPPGKFIPGCPRFS